MEIYIYIIMFDDFSFVCQAVMEDNTSLQHLVLGRRAANLPHSVATHPVQTNKFIFVQIQRIANNSGSSQFYDPPSVYFVYNNVN